MKANGLYGHRLYDSDKSARGWSTFHLVLRLLRSFIGLVHISARGGEVVKCRCGTFSR